MSDIQYGAFLAIPDGIVAEAVTRTGFDYVCIDGQHGLLGFDKALAMMQAMSSSGATPISPEEPKCSPSLPIRNTNTMLKSNDSVSFVATLDAATSRVFYEQSLGLRLVADEHFALVFDLNGHTLRIAKVNALVPAKHAVLGWHVADIEEAIKGLVARGVIFERFEEMPQDELGIWASPSGAKVAWFKDPDGNNLSLTQLAGGDAA